MPYDNKTITSSLDDLVSRNVKYKKLYLVADGGYATKNYKLKIFDF
jgi:hypothetical protein